MIAAENFAGQGLPQDIYEWLSTLKQSGKMCNILETPVEILQHEWSSLPQITTPR